MPSLVIRLTERLSSKTAAGQTPCKDTKSMTPETQSYSVFTGYSSRQTAFLIQLKSG